MGFINQVRLAISETELGGTYHIQGLCKGYASEYPQNMALYGTVPPFYDPEISIESMEDRWRTP